MQRNDTGSESSEHEEHSNNDANETRDVQQQLMRADTVSSISLCIPLFFVVTIIYSFILNSSIIASV